MNIEHKTRALALVNELRSGRWTQASNYLQSGEREGCCLGVGCALAAKLGAELDVVVEQQPVWQPGDAITMTGEVTVWLYDNERHYLPGRAIHWFGFSNDRGTFSWLNDDPILDGLDEVSVDMGNGADGRPSLAGLNDNGIPFETIADLIEDEVLNGNRRGLFADNVD